ncbi:hypothetical protein [Sphingomonas desiccabilis]|uniref:hypothetical protein n=1 Tax=Sphingomonas desiccabilis TaxID=429134 RepID=UPI001806938B|nr:hypothetical protein [Sphingomonas desiccabilis]MBB3910855.1 hypothetical protein [Sphingomonas desiccabilis]
MFGWLNRKRAAEPVAPGAALSKIGHDQRRALIRAKADEMRASMGLPAAAWPPL